MGGGGGAVSSPTYSYAQPGKPFRPLVFPGDAELEVFWSPPSDGGDPITDYDVRYSAGSGSWLDWSFTGAGLTTEEGFWSGLGFVAQTSTGTSKPLLRPSVQSVSGLAVATSADQMSDVLPEAPPGTYDHAVEQDFVRAPNTILRISQPGAPTTVQGEAWMTDSGIRWGSESPSGDGSMICPRMRNS